MMSLGVGAAAQQLAFPGAEGFGRYTLGARAVAKPEVYHVTNLNDSGAGSLRDAVSKEGRIVVFDVAGTIKLESALVFKGNNTVLGQTAPGEGINVYGDRVSFSGASNLIVRYIRFRMGINGTSGKDACGVANGTDMIFDHLSVLWGRDENFSISWDNKGTRPGNITIQNSIIAQGLQSHSCGGLIQTIGGVTLYRNLYAENKTRNPKVKGLNQFVNNVVYNWGNGGCYIMSESVDGQHWADIENNYFVKGPWKSTDPFIRGVESFRFYGVGNYYDSNASKFLDGRELTTDEMLGKSGGHAPYSTPLESFEALNAHIDAYNAANNLTPSHADYIKNIPAIAHKLTAQESYAWMIDSVGPSFARDACDEYIIDLLRSNGKNGSTNGIGSERELPHHGEANISGGVKPLDTDNDGIPDEWELAHGLNINDASDAVAINADGYTNLESYSFTITTTYPYIKKPLKLAVTNQGKNTLTLSWDVNGNADHGFVVEASTDGKTFAEVAKAEAGVTTVVVEGLTPASEYQLRLRATDGKGLYSDYSNTVATETIDDPSAPKPSVNPFPADGAKEGVAAGITFTWENNVKTYGGTVYYTLYLGDSVESMTAVATDITATKWEDKDLQSNKTYYWRVDARNDIGTTPGTLWSFSTTSGGVLFYADFYNLPAAWGVKYAGISDNTNVFNAANQRVEFDGMVIGSGENAIRAIAMNGANNSSDTTKDYGPATDEDAGASDRCLQFYTTKAGAYVETPEVQGPCVLTLYLGNPDKASKTVKLVTVAGGKEESQNLVLGANKRVYKFTSTYTNAGSVKFRLDANAKKINVNDIIVERYVPGEGEETLELTAGSLDNSISYVDGNVTLGFNQTVKYNGTATIAGVKDFEDFVISTSGSKLTISYECLDVNSVYTVTFPEGALTNVDGSKSFIAEVKLSTSDFSATKQSGETHYGKAATTLPLNFAPFNAVAPFESVGGLVQTSQSDYPHWVQASSAGDSTGEVTADYVKMTNKNDKVMAYFGGTAKFLHLEVALGSDSNARVFVQEARNPDVDPKWRTMRVLTATDLPFNGEFALNPESRFVKISVPTVSGEVYLNSLRISDADGNFGADFSGIADVIADREAEVEYFNLQGVRVANPTPGLYIRRQGTRVEKVVIR
ncbi:MAG: fibronectin type III domain-containing protein [Bacteroides sp.]|nr:fibronectin type III domain-containing protein [Bacteroides sp.]